MALRALGAGAVALVVVVVVALVVPAASLPSTSLTWTGRSLGGPWASGVTGARIPPTPLASVGTGTYQVTLTETLTTASGRASRLSFQTTPAHRVVVSNWFSLRAPTSMRYLTITAAPLDLAHAHVATVVLTPTTTVRRTEIAFSTPAASTFSFSFGLSPNTSLNLVTLQLRKTGN